MGHEHNYSPATRNTAASRRTPERMLLALLCAAVSLALLGATRGGGKVITADEVRTQRLAATVTTYSTGATASRLLDHLARLHDHRQHSHCRHYASVHRSHETRRVTSVAGRHRHHCHLRIS